MRSPFLLIFLLYAVSNAYSQSLPKLSRQQMYADFDTLTKRILEVSPQGPVRQAVSGLDVSHELKKLRTTIGSCHTAADFAALVRAGITLCQDGHTSLLRRGYFSTAAEAAEAGVSPEGFQLAPLYDSVLRRSVQKKLNLRLKYLQGNYYNVYKFTYQGTTVPAGWKLTKCNGIDIHRYVGGLMASVPMMRWDFTRKRYYAENFADGFHLSAQDTLHLLFQDKSAKPLAVSLPLSTAFDYPSDNYVAEQFNSRKDSFKTVRYLPEAHLLYIRVPFMNLADTLFYPTRIKEEAKKGLIQKVAIDIRNNPGGADNVWTGILSSLIAKPITYQMVLLCNPSKTVHSRLAEGKHDWKPYSTPFLKKAAFDTYFAGESSIEPDSATIGFSGTIYVIQNENIYSSAGALAAVAGLSPQLLSVGTPTGKLLGRGINPLVFELPHSKILYRIEPVIDFMNVSSSSDVFHDKVEMPMELTIREYMARMGTTEPLYTPAFLLRKDPIFKKIVALSPR